MATNEKGIIFFTFIQGEMATVKEPEDNFFTVQWNLKEFWGDTGSTLQDCIGQTNFICQSEWLPRTQYGWNFSYNATTSKLALTSTTNEKAIIILSSKSSTPGKT
jgi:hypothetical protein